MAPSFACVFALLVSQVTVVSAGTSPFNDPANTNSLACTAYSAGCECTGIGKVANSSAASTDCTGSTADMNNCHTACCGDPAVATCGSLHFAGTDQCRLDATLELDASSVTKVAGAVTDQKTNCCKKKVTATCSQVTCNVNRRRTAVAYKAKAGVLGTLACTSNSDCEDKCCEKNPLMCGGLSASDMYTLCGTNHTSKSLSATGAAPTCVQTPTAAMTATFTETADNATFKAACCDLKPAGGTCGTTPTCPTHYEPRSTLPTKCLGATCQDSECCQRKAGVTRDVCSSNCTSGTDKTFTTTSGCSYGATTYCSSTRCAAGLVLDKSKAIYNLVNATDATFSTTCCISKPAAPALAKCSAYFVAAAAGAAKGTTSSAYMQGASFPILVVAVPMLMKF